MVQLQTTYVAIIVLELILFWLYTIWLHREWSLPTCLMSSMTYRMQTIIILEFTLYVNLLLSMYSRLNLYIKHLYKEHPKIHWIQVQEKGSSDYNMNTSGQNIMVDNLAKVQEIYSKVYRCCNLLSRYHGSRVFLIIVRTVCLLTSTITEFTFSLGRAEAMDPGILLIKILFLVFTAYSMSVMSFLIVRAVDVKDLVAQTPLLLYRVANKYRHDKNVQTQVELLIIFIRTHEIEITTNGLLDLDFKLIIMILSAVATYVIILVQLQQR